jgi:hypothetical protein
MKNIYFSPPRERSFIKILGASALLLVVLMIPSLGHAQVQTVFTPNENFTVGLDTGLNGFNGADLANTSDDFTYTAAAAACVITGEKVAISLSMSGTFCPGDFATATVTVNNQSGIDLSNTLLTLNLTNLDALFSGEPYNITNNLRLVEPNVFDPAYPAVPNALSGTTGSQSLDIITLPNGSSTFDIDLVVGNTTAAPLTNDLQVLVSQISTSINVTGISTAVGTVTVGVVPSITGTPPGAVTIGVPSLSLSYSATNASSVSWTSGSTGSFTNAAAASTTYTINDLDRANGFVDLSLQAINGTCSTSVGFRVGITGATFDYGDALSSYDFGATVGDVVASATISSDVFLGAILPDTELNVLNPSALANGDDIDGTDDEDGLVAQSFSDAEQGQIYSFNVSATNTSANNAYLHAFIDWNNDGDFIGDEGEKSNLVTVANGSGTATYAVTFTVPANYVFNVNSMIRLRLSSDEFAAGRAFGPAPNGEVEDHSVEFVLVKEYMRHGKFFKNSTKQPMEFGKGN